MGRFLLHQAKLPYWAEVTRGGEVGSRSWCLNPVYKDRGRLTAVSLRTKLKPEHYGSGCCLTIHISAPSSPQPGRALSSVSPAPVAGSTRFEDILASLLGNCRV